MNKVVKRLLVFFIGIPVVFGLCISYHFNHLALNIAAVVVSGICAYEFHRMISNQFTIFNKWLTIMLTILQPVSTYFLVYFKLDTNINTWILLFTYLFIMGAECFVSKSFENSIKKIAGTMLIIFYAGYMVTFITRLTSIELLFTKHGATWFMVLFFIIVFMCDSAAWLFGVLWGKTTRGYFAASPNKSIVGFIGGIAAGIFFACMMQLLLPDFFGSITKDYWKPILIGFCTSIAAIIGDLVESVFKRSCNVKDSGKIMGGRGGLLDSIDSLVLAAPIFYLLVNFVYNV